MKNLQRREETKLNILNAATACFAENGYNGTGVAEICNQAGVSKGAFYYHFESKEAVFLHLINNWLENTEQMLNNAVKSNEGKTAPEIFRKMSAMMQEVFQPDNSQASLFLELWTQATRSGKIREATIAPYKKYHEIFSDLIRQGIKEGSFYPVDPNSGAQAILSMTSGLFLQGLLDPEGVDRGKAAEDSIKIILKGLQKEVTK